MEYKEFKKLIDNIEKTSSDFRELYNLGFDFFDSKYPVEDGYSNLVDLTLDLLFEEIGSEWVCWWIYENDFGRKKLKAFDGDKQICKNIWGLWNHIKIYEKTK